MFMRYINLRWHWHWHSFTHSSIRTHGLCALLKPVILLQFFLSNVPVGSMSTDRCNTQCTHGSDQLCINNLWMLETVRQQICQAHLVLLTGRRWWVDNVLKDAEARQWYALKHGWALYTHTHNEQLHYYNVMYTNTSKWWIYITLYI